MNRIEWMLLLNFPLVIVSFVGLWVLDYPLELIPAVGIAWVWTNSIGIIIAGRRRRKR